MSHETKQPEKHGYVDKATTTTELIHNKLYEQEISKDDKQGRHSMLQAICYGAITLSHDSNISKT